MYLCIVPIYKKGYLGEEPRGEVEVEVEVVLLPRLGQSRTGQISICYAMLVGSRCFSYKARSSCH